MPAASSFRTDAVRNITIRSRTEGFAETKAELQGLSDSQDNVAASSERMATVTETSAKRQTSLANAFEGMQRRVDDAYRAQQRFAADERLGARFIAQGGSVTEVNRILDLSRQKYLGVGQANDNLAKSVGLQSHEWKNLGMQANDAATMLLSGSSAFQVVATQGGQVLQVLQGAQGGIGGALKSIGAGALSLVTPLTVATGAIVATGAAGVLAYRSFSEGQEGLQRSLSGLGRSSDATVDSINRMSPAWSTAGKVSTAQARDMAGTFAATGQIGSAMFGDLIKATKDYARTTGMELPDAAQALASAFKDPVRGADKLNETMGFLSDASRDVVRRLVNQGDQTAAQQALLNAMQPSLRHVVEDTNAWSVALTYVTKAARDAYDATGQAIHSALTGGSAQEQARRAEDARRHLQDVADQRSKTPALTGSPLLDNPAARSADLMDARLLTGAGTRAENLGEVARRQSQAGYADMLNAEAAGASLRARAAIDAMVPTDADIRQLEDFQSAVTKALRVPGTLSNEGAARAGLDLLGERLKAGGTAAFELEKAAKNAFALAPLQGYARELEVINQKYREQVDLAIRSGNLAGWDTLMRSKAADLASLQIATQQAALRPLAEENVTIGMSAPAARRAALQKQLGDTSGPLDQVDVAGTRARTMAPVKPVTYDFFKVFGGSDTQASGYTLPPKVPTPELFGNTDAKDRLLSALQARALDTKGAVDRGSELGNLNAVKRTTDQLSEASRALTITTEAEAKAIGKTASESARLNTEARLRAQLGAKGEVFDAEAVKRYADKIAEATENMARLRMTEQVSFARDQIGRSTADQQIASTLRSSGMGGIEDPRNATIAQQLRLNDTLKTGKDLTSDFARGFGADIMNATRPLDALFNGLKRIESKLLDMATDSLVSKAFAGLMGTNSGSGGSGGLFDIFGKLAGAASKGLDSWMPKYDVGGYTGAGGRLDPAGIVHRGEYVFSRDAVDRIGLGALDQLHSGRWSGYDRGGFVGSPSNLNFPVANGNAAPVVNIYNSEAGTVQATATTNPQTGHVDVQIRALEGALAARMAKGRGSLEDAVRGTAADRAAFRTG